MTTEEAAAQLAAWIEVSKRAVGGRWTFSPMSGTEAHCFAAQVWADGRSLVVVADWPGASKASAVAESIALSRSMPDAVVALVREAQEIALSVGMFSTPERLDRAAKFMKDTAPIVGEQKEIEG